MSVAQAPVTQLKDGISTRIDALRPELERIGRDIHANPEIAYEERQAVGWLTALLREQGFDVEGGGGKIRLIRAGIFQEVDAAMMFHPDAKTQVLHWALAVTHMQFEFIGRAAHASGDPEKGINALDAFVLAYNGISMLRQHIKE